MSPEEITLITQGFHFRKEIFSGRPTIIEGGKYGSELRIIRTRYSLMGMPVPNEDLYIYNIKGNLLKKMHISKY